MLKITMPSQDLVVLGWVLQQETPAYHKIRLVTLIALRLIVFPGRRQGIVITRISLVTQTMEARLTKPTYREALGIVTLNLMSQIQRVVSKALELYIIATRMTNTDHTPAIGIITKVIQIILPTTMVRNKIIDPIGIDIGAMIIVHRGDKQDLQQLLGAPKTALPLHTGEQLDLLMMRNSILKNITKQTFCFFTVLSYVTMSVKNEK